MIYTSQVVAMIAGMAFLTFTPSGTTESLFGAVFLLIVFLSLFEFKFMLPVQNLFAGIDRAFGRNNNG